MLPFIIASLFFVLVIAFAYGNLSIFICGAFYTVIIASIARKLFGRNKRFFQRLTLIWITALSFIIIVYFLYYKTYGIPYDKQGMDDYFYDVIWSDDCLKYGYMTISNLLATPEYYFHNSKTYLLLIVWMKYIFRSLGGYHTIDIRMFNMMLLTISGMLMGKYAEKYLRADKKTTIRIVTAISLFPNAMFISSLVYRDALVAFFIVSIFYLWTRFLKKTIKEKFLIIFITIIITYLTYYCRVQAVLYLVLAIGVGILNDNPDKNILFGKSYLRKILLFFIAFILLFNVGDAILANFNRFINSYNKIISSGTGIQAKIRGIPLLPAGWIFQTLFFLITPMYRDIIPIEVVKEPISILRGFVSWGTIYLLFLYPYVFKFLKRMNNIVVTYAVILLSVAIVTSGFRHVMMTYPMLLTIGIIGRSQASEQSVQNARLMSAIVTGIFGFAFVLLKVL